MIPKVIHYCWFGGKPLPESAVRYIESWKKYMPDYEIREWNESNFDIDSVLYVKQAYEAKKYAFVSDYVRFWVLYRYGGIYFDTDVEVIRPLDDILAKGAFMGCEISLNGCVNVAPGLGLAAYPQMAVYKEIIDEYSCKSFFNADGSQNLKTVVTYVTEILYKYGFVHENRYQNCAGLNIYPSDFFCPLQNGSKKCIITKNTY